MDRFVQMFSSGLADEGEEGNAPERDYTPPPWFGPPTDELGWCVPLSIVVGRSDHAIVAIRAATAYSTGATFDLVALGRGLSERETNRLFHEQHLIGDEAEPPDGFLRIGFEFADGVRVSNLARDLRTLRPDSQPTGPLLFQHGGGGGSAGGGELTMQPSLWLWPLPPPGALRVFVEWPALGIELSSATLDGATLRPAAAKSQNLWTDS